MANLENNTIWPDVEERIVDLIEAHNSTSCSPTRGGSPSDSPHGSTRFTPNASGSNSARANPRVGGGAPAHIMASGQTLRRRTAAGEGAPRLGQQGTARHRRGRPQERAAQGRRRHLEPRTRHRHGCGRSGDPGGGAAVGGQRAATHRSRRPPGRRDLARRAVPQAPHRPDRLRGHRAAHARRADRDHAGAGQPARRARPAHRRRLRAGTARRRPLVRRRAAQRTVRHAAAQRLRGDARPAVRQVPVHRVRRAAAAAGLRPRRGHADRPARCAAARRHLRRRHPRPRPVHGVPGIERRLREALPGRRTRRGDGLRVTARRRHLTGRHQLADHRDHPRPGAGHPRPRPAGPVAVLARRRRRPTRRTGRGDRRVHRQAVRHDARGIRQTHCRTIGFNDFATDNLWQLLDEQRQATGTVPTDTTFIVERFRDELGDWRVILHSPYGLRVHGPLALAVGRRLRERYGIDEKPTASDDGIIVRLPDTDESAPGADLFVFDADEIDPIVTDEVGGSALFASRFRECAARALLLPRRHPGKRSPLWHQRQRAAQLLDVARKYPDFPIVLETVRECLQDVYDVPTLRDADESRCAAPHSVARGRDGHTVAVRRVAAVRLRRGVHVRGRQPAGRTPRRRAVAGQRAARRAARPCRTARAARPADHRVDHRASCST